MLSCFILFSCRHENEHNNSQSTNLSADTQPASSADNLENLTIKTENTANLNNNETQINQITYVPIVSGINVFDFDKFYNMDEQAYRQYVNSIIAPNSLDCGTAKVIEERHKVDSCAVDSFQKFRAFHVHYEFGGIDSQVIYSMIFIDLNHFYRLGFDSDPSGGGRRNHGIIYQRPCAQPQAQPLPISHYNLPFECTPSYPAYFSSQDTQDKVYKLSPGPVLCKFMYNIYGCLVTENACNKENESGITGEIISNFEKYELCAQNCQQFPYCVAQYQVSNP